MKRSPLKRKQAPRLSRIISPATSEQRAKCRGRSCIVCGNQLVDPGHIIDRSLCPAAGDDVLMVVPLCRAHHREYDEGDLDLLPHIEPVYRHELGHAVWAFGLISTLERVTNCRWRPVGEE